MKRLLKSVFILSVLSALALSPCLADEGKGGSLQSVEFLTGYGFANIKRQTDYRIVPFLLDLGFNLKPLTKKWGINYSGLQQFIIEPFVSYACNSPVNAEIGNNFVLKVGLLPDNWALQPYIKGGAGFMYMSRHFRQQSTQLNFTEFISAGLHYFLTKNTALTAEYRYRHLSNADTKRPNTGIGTVMSVCGISYFF